MTALMTNSNQLFDHYKNMCPMRLQHSFDEACSQKKLPLIKFLSSNSTLKNYRDLYPPKVEELIFFTSDVQRYITPNIFEDEIPEVNPFNEVNISPQYRDELAQIFIRNVYQLNIDKGYLIAISQGFLPIVDYLRPRITLPVDMQLNVAIDFKAFNIIDYLIEIYQITTNTLDKDVLQKMPTQFKDKILLNEERIVLQNSLPQIPQKMQTNKI